ncbi:DUF397 domain-containing protein [Nonomuraea dietziae]|uniref:DUF397 domain-containing protein n=1 Tax=Nonomuraea dietziae TaxID=65515 RepID=UPI0036214B5B
MSESAEFPWRKSTWSDGTGGGCVSVAHLGNGCAIRDSKDPGPYLLVSLGSWRAFIEGIRRAVRAGKGRGAATAPPPLRWGVSRSSPRRRPRLHGRS